MYCLFKLRGIYCNRNEFVALLRQIRLRGCDADATIRLADTHEHDWGQVDREPERTTLLYSLRWHTSWWIRPNWTRGSTTKTAPGTQTTQWHYQCKVLLSNTSKPAHKDHERPSGWSRPAQCQTVTLPSGEFRDQFLPPSPFNTDIIRAIGHLT